VRSQTKTNFITRSWFRSNRESNGNRQQIHTTMYQDGSSPISNLV